MSGFRIEKINNIYHLVVGGKTIIPQKPFFHDVLAVIAPAKKTGLNMERDKIVTFIRPNNQAK